MLSTLRNTSHSLQKAARPAGAITALRRGRPSLFNTLQNNATFATAAPQARAAAVSQQSSSQQQHLDAAAQQRIQAAATALWTNKNMTNSEAFVETLVAHGVTDVFGIVGSAFMDALDLFPDAGIRFISVQHEQGAAHMADGYARRSGRHGVVIGQNGPGVTNCVTGIAAAYWAHSPVVMITPECATAGKGLGG